MIVFRFALECGHTRLTGPWPNDESRHMIGDITICELCPKTPERYTDHLEYALRQIVQVDDIPARQYRKPSEELEDARDTQIQAP